MYKEGIERITLQDPRYPHLLKEIKDPPAELYVRGDITCFEAPKFLAVVGSRKATSYGKQAIEKLLPPVARAGIVLVSGMAYGIDSLTHQISVAENMPTIAVLGTGIDDKTIYPRANLKLAKQLLEHNGLIISEFPPGTPPLKHHFPMRNRIITGLCQVTLIIQAAEKSGSLITARLATEYNRDVAAVPGMITDPMSAGTNQLIRQGAHVVLEPQDILQLFGITVEQEKQISFASLPSLQQTIVSHLEQEPLHIDDLIVKLAKPVEEVTTLLLELEMSGHIQQVGGMKYIKK